MAFNIFYSWQLSTPSKFNKRFILECLEEAVQKLNLRYNNEINFVIDHDTKQEPGYPNIIETIQKKVIHESDIFIGDLTVIGRLANNKAVFNPNVIMELGIAKGALGSERIIPVMNIAYGDPNKETIMPFDIAQYRFPFSYDYSEGHSNDEKKIIKKKLANNLLIAITSIYESENERRKKEYHPFETWKTWDQVSDKTLDFEEDDQVITVLNTLKDNLKIHDITRLQGLSGIGKTKIVLECFRPNNTIGTTPDISDKILYVNINECDSNDIISQINMLIRTGKRKIIILDNCPASLHENLQPKIIQENSFLTLITISPEPDENKRDFDSSGKTVVIKLLSGNFKEIVKKLLRKNFTLEESEIETIIDFSNGLPFYAVMLAQNKNHAIKQPGTITSRTLLNRILGESYIDPEKRKVILAAAIFQRFGYTKENEHQYHALATSDAICPLKMEDGIRVRFFKSVCEELKARNILEEVGFSLSFRPTPVALQLAEQWWAECSVEKFKQILPVLQEHDLVENFCKQFRLLPHVEHAKDIVAQLCDGVFRSAEVLNTEEGSRIFRSFVYVNPIVCVNTLEIAFDGMPKEKLLQIKKGRRNLVWALEQLCYLPETFVKAAKLIAAFAIAENEDIANNSLNQFLQLFHVYLPGTVVDLHERWRIIEFCANNGDDYYALAIEAAIRSLKSDSFMRMNGPLEKQPEEDYHPNGEEVMDYWNKSILFLENAADQNPDFTTKIENAFFSNLYSLTTHSAGEIMLSAIIRRYKTGSIDWLELKNLLEFIIRSNKVFDMKIKEKMNVIIQEITPDDLNSRIRMHIVRPSNVNYGVTDEKKQLEFSENIIRLVEEFLENPQKWFSIIEELSTGIVSEGLKFGKCIASKSTKEQFIGIIDLAINAIIKEKVGKNNISFFIGLIRGFKDEKTLLEIFETIINSPEKKFLIFSIVSNIDFPFNYIERVINLVRTGEFDVSVLSCFNYGWGLKHLSKEEKLNVLMQVSSLNEGAVQAFIIATTWSYGDNESWKDVKDFLHEIILNHSNEILNSSLRSMDLYQWTQASVKLLLDKNDNKLAVRVTEIIIENLNTNSNFAFRGDFDSLFNVLQDKYFEILWEALIKVYTNSEKYALTAFHLRDFLSAKENTNYQTEGLIFGGNTLKFEIIYKWVKDNPSENVYWITELLPVFNNKEDSDSHWHPYALKFLDDYGNREGILDGISSNIGTFSWTGSPIGRYEKMKLMYEELISHPISEVKRWAIINLEWIKERIESEKNRQIEFGS